MGIIGNFLNFIKEILVSGNRKGTSEEIVIRVKESMYAGMKVDYGWSTMPLNKFLDAFKGAELPSLIKVMVDVPEGIEEGTIKINPNGKKVIVKIPGKVGLKIDLPYNVSDEYKANLKNNVLFILLRRAESGMAFQ